jgi:hypothetical protein
MAAWPCGPRGEFARQTEERLSRRVTVAPTSFDSLVTGRPTLPTPEFDKQGRFALPAAIATTDTSKVTS